MKTILAIILCCLISTHAKTYNAQNHEIITKHAIDYLNLQLGYEFISEKEAKRIIKGNLSEDKFGIKWLNRLWNQHFYNPKKPKHLWRRSKSIDVRFERIAKRWKRRTESAKYFKSIGEIVHHIQDATCPPHVVPVYHGGPIKDSFDEQCTNHYLPEALALNLDLSFSAPYHLSILEPVASRTLESLKDTFEVRVKQKEQEKTEKMDWSVFWQSDSTRWFGCYGQLGAPANKKGKRRDQYEKTIIQSNNQFYQIEKSVFTNYSSKQVSLAVQKTAEFIYYSKMQLK